MAKIIKVESIMKDNCFDDGMKLLISKLYHVPTARIHCFPWSMDYEKNTVRFGWYLGKQGYKEPVAYQTERGEIEILSPSEYFMKKYVKEEPKHRNQNKNKNYKIPEKPTGIKMA